MSAPLFLDKLDDAIHNNPNHMAIIDLQERTTLTLTYAELDQLANRCALGLLERGVQTGDAVAYQLPSGWPFIVLTVALWRIGAVPCPMLPPLREREVNFIMASSGSRLLITPDVFRKFDYRELAARVQEEVSGIDHVIVIDSEATRTTLHTLGGLLVDATALNDGSAMTRLQQRRAQADDHSQLLYTSGTTGEPKGVLHTHQTLSNALLAHTMTLGLTADDNIWVPSPLAHQTGFLYGMLVAFYIGGTGVYQAVWSVDKAREAIETHGSTFVQAAMPFLSDLTKNDQPPKGLRLFIATGAAIPRQLAHAARERLGCSVVGAWGSTEGCLVTVGRPGDPVDKLVGTDGRVIDGMGIRIVDDEGRVVPAGQEGNYQIQTPAMFVTYLHHHEWFEAAFTEDGWFDTGDLATIDEDGYLRITGRKKDVVNRGGEKIPVVEIENLLYQHFAVADVAVVAMPDDRLGERACAYVTLNEGYFQLDLAEVTDFLGVSGMAKIYWPERIELISEMPRTASGKIQKYVLRQDITKKLMEEGAIEGH